MKARKRVIQGGTSAGKTYAVIPVLIDRALKNPRLKITVVAETLPAVKEGALDIFMNIMNDTNRWIDANWNASSLTYTFGNKTRFQFKSFDSVGKAKAAGKRDILFLNEANTISFEIADALMIRSKETYIDFNPDDEFWVHTEVLTEPNSEFLLLTYQDNEALPIETLEDLLIKKSKAFHDVNVPDSELFKESNIKSSYWANWWKVYGLGQVGNLEGVIFNEWKEIETIPTDAKLIGYGLDFGYTNDPTTLTAIYEMNNEHYFDELIYEKGMSNSMIANRCKQLGCKEFIYADSAEPKSIAEIKSFGIKIKEAIKGADSIKFGIHEMQEKPFYVTKRSVNLKEELKKYKWDKDRDGKPLNVPIDAWNHCIDGIRYFFQTKKKLSRKYYAA